MKLMRNEHDLGNLLLSDILRITNMRSHTLMNFERHGTRLKEHACTTLQSVATSNGLRTSPNEERIIIEKIQDFGRVGSMIEKI